MKSLLASPDFVSELQGHDTSSSAVVFSPDDANFFVKKSVHYHSNFVFCGKAQL